MSENWIHLCIDMQRMFSEDTPWHVPWMSRVSPTIVEIADRFPERTVFTRFIPPTNAGEMTGTWRDYYRKWEAMTLDRLDRELIELIPDLRRFSPPARVFDKMTYSPWVGGNLNSTLRNEHVETLVITGGETDVCVLAAVLGAVDLGYRVKVVKDALCSGDDDTRDASLELLGGRFSMQVEIVDTETVLRDMVAEYFR
ncbi:cysteine hydrolase [Rhizobium cauense]|uniref:cysteine hydrolase family protein n=1 Tax=Rhizobium cauense TaxID=1166683 RepID=UPI001C6E1AD2|nr:isochorismatase family cysteine hydrolase [Rhizobium cauense]MBW9118093.1 cysteine hydrolase [Rhizobium cauense]